MKLVALLQDLARDTWERLRDAHIFDPIAKPEIPADLGNYQRQTREVIEALRELASLKESGFLSDEFAAAKKDLLARI